MNITDGLKYFVGSALVKNKGERFIGFLSNTKGNKKFLASLDHDLENSLIIPILSPIFQKLIWNSKVIYIALME